MGKKNKKYHTNGDNNKTFYFIALSKYSKTLYKERENNEKMNKNRNNF